MVDFNTKTQNATFTLKTGCTVTNITMNGADVATTDTLSVLGVSVSSEFSCNMWNASQKLAYLFRARKYCLEQLLTLEKKKQSDLLLFYQHFNKKCATSDWLKNSDP